MKLPFLLSVPHAGLEVPDEVAKYNGLTPEQIVHDGDEGASVIYDLSSEVEAYVTTNVARAYIDMNRAPDDIRKDGVVKTHTCWDEPIWHRPPPQNTLRSLVLRYHKPYHDRLTQLADVGWIGVDCHTMAAAGPPIGPDPGVTRPLACIGIGDGTCPREWAELLATEFRTHLGDPVEINQPFRGGHIIRAHATEKPWLMIELSRTPALSNAQKKAGVLAALRGWAKSLAALGVGSSGGPQR